MKLRKLKILSFLLAFTMIASGLGMNFQPMAAYAQGDKAIKSEAELNDSGDSNNLAKADTASLKGKDSTSIARSENRQLEDAEFVIGKNATAKLYAYDDSSFTNDLMVNAVTENNTNYKIKLAAGDYILQIYDGDSLCGSMKIVVTTEDQPKSVGDQDQRNHFLLVVATGFGVSNRGWVEGTDYTVEYSVSNNKSTFDRESVPGKDSKGKISLLALNGDNIHAAYTPNFEKHPNYLKTVTAKTVNVGFSWFPQTSIPEGVNVKINVPKGAQADAGNMHTYYIFDFFEPEDVDKSAADKDVFTFKVPKGKDCFYRVKMDDKDAVTYWNYKNWRNEAEETVTEEDLHIGDDFDADTICRKFERNNYDLSDIYLNINEKGYMNMEQGESFTINAFRNWFLVENFMNAKVALPDFEYKVIDFNGNPSDVVSIKPNAKNSAEAVMTANKNGQAVVLVTYDAVSHMANQMPNGSPEYAAIWPERTGVFVVSVGKDGSTIDTGMTINEKINYNDQEKLWEKKSKDRFDAEHDIIFYSEKEGGKYSFEPEKGCYVEVARPTLTKDSLTYTGFSQEGVSQKDGKVTVSGLKTGRNIVKLTKRGLSTYQVITAQEVSYDLLDEEGQNELAEAEAGEEVVIQFHGLTNPCEKLSGVYNFNTMPHFVGSDGKQYNDGKGGIGVYGFSSDPKLQRLKITIPDGWDKPFYTLSQGNLKMGGFGDPAGNHRTTTYAKGKGQNFTARSVRIFLGKLPDVRIPIKGIAKNCQVTFDNQGQGQAPEAQTLFAGDPAKDPGQLSAEGYIFNGWYNGDEKWNFEEAVNEDMTLTAKWTKLCKVDFDVNGGQAGPDSQRVETAKQLAKPADPTRSGYSFLGWYNGDNKWDFSQAVEGDMTLKARWKANAPKTFSGYASGNYIYLSWAKSNGVDGYIIQKAVQKDGKFNYKPWVTVKDGSQTAYRTYQPDRHNNYSYRICPYRNVDGVKKTGYWSYSYFGEVTLKQNETVSLKPMLDTNNSVIWKAYDRNVASVDSNGKISSKNIGKTTVTAIVGKTRFNYRVVVAPSAPKNLKAVRAGKYAKLSWTPGAGQQGIYVYRGEIKNGEFEYKLWVHVKGSKAAKLTTTLTKANTTYAYKVKAYRVIDDKRYETDFTNTQYVSR